ncbi:MAG: hypothetical protein J1F03_02100 [Oscillospiraceae bacterium]|nr:hypothetical protein [Oscillospiraceae bacterium]
MKQRNVPGATVALYIVMVVVILGICAVVFVIGFNALNSNESSNSSISRSSGFILPNNEVISSSSSENSFVDSSDENNSSSSDVQSESSSSDQNVWVPVQSSSSSSENTLPMNFSKEFFKNDLFIGDSIFTGLYLYEHIDQENVAARVGYTPYGALNTAFDGRGITALDYAKQRSPKRIFILLGSNALDSSEINALKNSYSNMLTTFKSEFPSAKICCISITPVARKTDYVNVKNSDVKLMNEYIKEQCKALGIDYYDLCSVISDDDGYFLEEYAESDGMHFKSKTYKVLLSALQKKYS